MPNTVFISVNKNIYDAAQTMAKSENRSVGEQIEFWIKVGRTSFDNADLPIAFIQDVLASGAQNRSLAEKFIPELVLLKK